MSHGIITIVVQCWWSVLVSALSLYGSATLTLLLEGPLFLPHGQGVAAAGNRGDVCEAAQYLNTF